MHDREHDHVSPGESHDRPVRVREARRPASDAIYAQTRSHSVAVGTPLPRLRCCSVSDRSPKW